MKISTSGALGVKDHTYTVDAYTSGYGQGAVRKVEVRAIDTNDKVDGKLTFFNPQKMDKGSGVYDSTYTFEENDKHAIDYSCGTHKVEFDVVTNLGSTVTEGALPGVEAGYNGTPVSCIDTDAPAVLSKSAYKYKEVFKPATLYQVLTYKDSGSSGGNYTVTADPSMKTTKTSVFKGETVCLWFKPATGYTLNPVRAKCLMRNASWEWTQIPDSCIVAVSDTSMPGYTWKATIPNVTGSVKITFKQTSG